MSKVISQVARFTRASRRRPAGASPAIRPAKPSLDLGRGSVPWFDETFYRSTYTDIDANVADARRHFVLTGLAENRFPSATAKRIADTVLTFFPGTDVSAAALIASVPDVARNAFLGGDNDAELGSLFMPELYRGSIDAGPELPAEALLAHFLAVGWRDGHRPSALFHERWYRGLVAEREDVPAIDDANPYLHWFYIGRAAGLVPTPLFEAAHYLDVHADMRGSSPDRAFEHYLSNGVREQGRTASVHFDAAHYRRSSGLRGLASPLLDYIVRGQHIGLAPVRGIDLDFFASDNPWASSPAEESAIHARAKLRRLERPAFADMLEELETLEPQVVRPYGPRQVRMPPMIHPETTLVNEARPVAAALGGRSYDSIVLIPHCRMAGSAKVSGALIDALGSATDRSRVLVVTTDMSVFERSDWFPDDIDLFDFSAHVGDAPVERRARALLDLVRGLRPERLININSNVGWHLTTNYGRQLAEWMHLYVYLFCWDLDFKGNKGGYPIQWFLPTFDHCSGVFTDDATLRAELVARYAPSETLARRFVTLYEPATDRDIDYRDALAERAAKPGRRRLFWAGRFDRQKRLDLLVGIAAKLPDVEFLVFGKPVLNDGPDHLDAAPENIRLMGSYACIDDVPIASCDGFLYTSAWDGMPSVLIEMSSRTVPIVASEVGGVGELITPETGWPISDVDDVDAYVAAIEEMLADPDEAIARATRLREHTLALCTRERYEGTIAETLARETPRDVDDGRVFDTGETLLAGIVSDAGADETGTPADVTAVLTAHGEGALAAVSYRNFEAACADAEANGLVVERIVMLDRSDRQTSRVFEDRAANLRVVETDFGDQGAVRNLAAALARGEFVAFLDGDDLWGRNWLTEGCRYLRGAPENVIAHPEFCQFFSGTRSVFVNIDQEDPDYREDFLRHANYWDAMCMARRTTHLAFPYCKRRIRDGFAFEDWHWNCDTIAGGQVHKVVPDTLHVKRRRESSQTTKASGNRSLMPTTALTDYARLPKTALADPSDRAAA